MSPTRVPLIFGTMTIGQAGVGAVRNSDLTECGEIISVFKSNGHKELDTARMYGNGSTEHWLSELDLGDCSIDTKVYPVNPGDHAPSALRATFFASLEALKRKKVRVLYLHAPDRSVPFEETLEEMNKLHSEGSFEIFGLSNFASWEVAEVVGICKAKGWVRPKIYQAMYNAITRAIEPELVPCCRKLGLRIVVYNPLAGGLFAGKVTSVADAPTAGRFNTTTASGKMYRDRYLKNGNFDALNHLKSVAVEHDLRLTEIALRWCQHHSVLGPEDGVILGASSAEQLKQNCEDSAKGPLPDAVVAALDEAWEMSQRTASTYWRRRLTDLSAQLSASDASDTWKDVESTAHALANGLRVRDGAVDNHTALGQTTLPQALATLFASALHGAAIPSLPYIPAVFELLRVSANLCMDHDENRGQLLEVGLPQAIVSLLEGYAESIPNPPTSTPLPLTIPHLKVVRTAIGVLLNVSLNYDPVISRLRSLDSGLTIMKLCTTIYPPASWLTAAPSSSEENMPEAQEESWSLRSTISSWAWKTIVNLKEVKDETLQIFNPDVLPLLTPALAAFCPPFASSSILFREDSDMFSTLVQADFEVLEESCTLIESLSLDVEDVRLSLARGLNFPAEHGGVPCLCTILDFIETGDCPPSWATAFSEPDKKRRERVFSNCKAALIKSVVEVAGEERNEDVLWDDSEADNPGGEFVCKMIHWIKKYISDMDSSTSETSPAANSLTGRDDLVICASLSLGNLARREKTSTVLLSPPHSLAPLLASRHLLSPTTDIKVKHGVIGLLKHLAQSCAQSPTIHDALLHAEVVKHVSRSGVWDEKTDEMADIVQVGAIGIVKYMCNANVENTFALVLPTEGEDPVLPTGMSLIMALVKRTKSTPVRSEGTRVLVNVIKSLWSNDPAASPADAAATATLQGINSADVLAEKQKKRQDSMQAVLTPDCALALASLVCRSAKYPLLVNEGVVALSLMSTIKAGGPLALTAILTPIPIDAPLAEPVSATPSTSGDLTSGSDVSSPVVTTPSTRGRMPIPHNTLDMLIAVLRNVDNPANFQMEVRVNVCSFFAQLTRHTSGSELDRVKDSVRPVVESVSENLQSAANKGDQEMLVKATKKLLDLWA
ncbi:GTP binding protein [Favolaschia claudopus]|uniref:GTP binding protein n=1 Tax=Favolaschia claudopus TaxID=2862362 RepID=A0AAW0ANY2_9AGAR